MSAEYRPNNRAAMTQVLVPQAYLAEHSSEVLNAQSACQTLADHSKAPALRFINVLTAVFPFY